MADNARTLRDGFAKGFRIIEETLLSSLTDAADALLVDVSKNRTFMGFTGQTQTSYACGLYLNGKLEHVSVQKNWNTPPVRMKVQNGQVVYLKNPYEGQARVVVGRVDIVEPEGLALSLQQLQNYKAPKVGVALMITTGTEYSELLEAVRHLDVLTRTFSDAPSIIQNSWKKIP